MLHLTAYKRTPKDTYSIDLVDCGFACTALEPPRAPGSEAVYSELVVYFIVYLLLLCTVSIMSKYLDHLDIFDKRIHACESVSINEKLGTRIGTFIKAGDCRQKYWTDTSITGSYIHRI